MKLRFEILLGLLIFLSCGLVGDAQLTEKAVEVEHMKLRLPSRDTVVDSKVVTEERGQVVQVLARDIDGIIKEYVIEYQGGDNQVFRLIAFKGYQVPVIDVDIMGGIPMSQVPIRLIHASCVGGLKYAVVVTLGLSDKPVLQGPWYSLYVFRLLEGRYRRIYGQRDVGMGLLDILFLDLTGDCVPELIDISKPASLTFATVRRLRSTDKVEIVQEIEGNWISMDSSGVLSGDLNMSVGVRNGLEEKRTYYVWSGGAGKFEEVRVATKK